MRVIRWPKQHRRGSALIEFTLVGTFIFIPLLAGLASVGMNMVTAMQVENLTATAGQMFSSGQWSASQLETMLNTPTMAGTLQTSPTVGAGGLIILSEVQYSSANQTWACVPPQITIQIDQGGAGGDQSKYEPGCADNGLFETLMPGSVDGQVAYLAETYYNNPAFVWALAPANTNTGIYEKAVF